MDRPDAGSLPMQTATEMHQARIISGGTDFGPGGEHMVNFVTQHGHRDIGILDGKGATETATLFRSRQFDQFESTHPV